MLFPKGSQERAVPSPMGLCHQNTLTVLGLRPKPPDGATSLTKTRYEAREPAWRLLHAVALLKLHKARTRAHMAYHDLTGPHEPRQTKPKHILRAIRQRCTARLCYEHAKATHSARAEPKAGPRHRARGTVSTSTGSPPASPPLQRAAAPACTYSPRRRQPPRLRPTPSMYVWRQSLHLPEANTQPHRPGLLRPTTWGQAVPRPSAYARAAPSPQPPRTPCTARGQ